MLGIAMLPAIRLDNHVMLEADKIDDEWSDRCLAAEVKA